MPKPRPITVVRNFGGKRLAENAVPTSCVDWSKWECDPSPKFAGRKPTRGFAWGAAFPWHFDKEEKAFVVQGSATLIPDDTAAHGGAVIIGPRDMVTFPRGWKGQWQVDEKIVKYYAFFDGKGLRVDEASDDDDEDGWGEGAEDGEKADVTNEETALKRDAEEREVGTGQKAKRGKK